jgi:hypothetical protein
MCSEEALGRVGGYKKAAKVAAFSRSVLEAEARVVLCGLLRGAEGAALPRQWMRLWRPLPQQLKPSSFLARLCGTLRLCSEPALSLPKGQDLEAVPFPV